MRNTLASFLAIALLALPACGKEEKAASPAPAAQETTVSSTAATSALKYEERVLGKEDAPITIIEYASLGCSHCAHFAKTILPDVKKNYIETGKAKLIFRDFPLDPVSLQASEVARCLPKEQFFGFIDILFNTQAEWLTADGSLGGLRKVAAQAGMDAASVEACLANKAIEEGILTQRLHASNVEKVEATPTFLINGEKVTGISSYEEFAKKLEGVK